MPDQNGEHADRRAFARRRTLKSAVVVFNSRNSVVSGLVRDFCEAGAKFTVDFPVDLPRDIYLRFAADAEWKAEIAWQKGGREFGLRLIEKSALARRNPS